jgi:predicted nucleic acid-binding protein
MMTGGVDHIFVDTNILVYASVIRSPLHDIALNEIGRREGAGETLWISRQILREYLAVLSRPQAYTQPLSPATLVTQIEALTKRFRIAEDGPQVTANLLALIKQIPLGGKQVHDANIVATMQVHGIKGLLTHNVADFNRFAHIITLIPL